MPFVCCYNAVSLMQFLLKCASNLCVRARIGNLLSIYTVKEAGKESAAVPRGGGRGGAPRGRGGRGDRPNRDLGSDGTVARIQGGGGEDGRSSRPWDSGRGAYGGPQRPFRGGRRGGYGNGEAGGDSESSPSRQFERRSGTGRGYEMKREGAGRGNWGAPTDEVLTQTQLSL